MINLHKIYWQLNSCKDKSADMETLHEALKELGVESDYIDGKHPADDVLTKDGFEYRYHNYLDANPNSLDINELAESTIDSLTSQQLKECQIYSHEHNIRQIEIERADLASELQSIKKQLVLLVG